MRFAPRRLVGLRNGVHRRVAFCKPSGDSGLLFSMRRTVSEIFKVKGSRDRVQFHVDWVETEGRNL
jgi:hypothetical protein